jgi:hypothetical protein
MTNGPTIGVCVPTFGETMLAEFLHAWSPHWLADAAAPLAVHVFIHEDSPHKTVQVASRADLQITVTAQDDIPRELGVSEWIIPRGTGACRSFPIYLAWKAGCEYIVTLDHDCFPLPGQGASFLATHLKSFRRDRWFRTINGDEPRGIPYQRLGQLPIRVNHGLWCEVPDLDGPTSLVRMRERKPVALRAGHEVVPPGMAFPLCAMNVCYHRSIVPATYNLLMGLDAVGFDRFDDIWSGVLLKRVLDYKGWYVTSGEPFVRHMKQSNAFSNLRKEAFGIQIHEHFWDYILDASLEPGLTVTGAFKALAETVHDFPRNCPAAPSTDGYFPRLANAMLSWTKLFESAEADPIMA